MIWLLRSIDAGPAIYPNFANTNWTSKLSSNSGVKTIPNEYDNNVG